MKRLLLAAVVLAALVTGAVVAYSHSTAVQRDVFRSRRALDTFRGATEVTAERLQYRRDSPQNPFRLDSYDHEAPVAVALPEAQQIQRLLVRRSSYVWESAKPCAPDYGLAFTFRHADALVRVALCFECDTLAVFDSPETGAEHINREADFDPIRTSLAAVAKHVFPNDAEIQSLK